MNSSLLQFIFSLAITIISFWLGYFFQKKPKLIAFYSAVVDIPVKGNDGTIQKDPQGKEIRFRSHTIVLGNIGKSTANNVLIGHYVLPPNYTVFPPINIISAKENEICIPILVPNEFVSISYLYQPDLKFSDIHAYTKCNECLSIPANMKHINNLPGWSRSLAFALLFIGCITIIYWSTEIFLFFYRTFAAKC